MKRLQHCTFCKNHAEIILKKGHLCPFKNCSCLLCQLTCRAQMAMRHQQRVWRHQKQGIKIINQSDIVDSSDSFNKSQVCSKCRNHQKIEMKRKHACPFADCLCQFCSLTQNRREIMKYQQRVRRLKITSRRNIDSLSKEIEKRNLDANTNSNLSITEDQNCSTDYFERTFESSKATIPLKCISPNRKFNGISPNRNFKGISPNRNFKGISPNRNTSETCKIKSDFRKMEHEVNFVIKKKLHKSLNATPKLDWVGSQVNSQLKTSDIIKAGRPFESKKTITVPSLIECQRSSPPPLLPINVLRSTSPLRGSSAEFVSFQDQLSKKNVFIPTYIRNSVPLVCNLPCCFHKTEINTRNAFAQTYVPQFLSLEPFSSPRHSTQYSIDNCTKFDKSFNSQSLIKCCWMASYSPFTNLPQRSFDLDFTLHI